MTATRVSVGAISLSNSSHFSGHRQLEIGQARDIAARPAPAPNEAAADRIGDLHENDGYRAGLLQHCRHYWITGSDNDIWR